MKRSKITLPSYKLSDKEHTQNAIEWAFVTYKMPTVNDVVARVFDVVAKHRLHSKLKPNAKSASTRETKSALMNCWKGAKALFRNGMRGLKNLYAVSKDGYVVRV